jgi:hypothetical protein
MSNIIGGGPQIPILNSGGSRPTMESQMAAVMNTKTKALNSIANDKVLMDVYAQLAVNVQHAVACAFVAKYSSSSERVNDTNIRNYSELILTDIFSKLPL